MMKQYILTLAFTLLVGTNFSTAQKLEDRKSIREELAFPAGSSQLEIWNLNGAVTVETYGGSSIVIQVEKIIKANAQHALDTGMKEIGFEALANKNKAIIRMTGPCIQWSEADSGSWWNMDHSREETCNWERGYTFAQNFLIQVPADTDLRVSTVNQGEILVRGLRAGHLNAGNVNGGITLEDVTGITQVNAVNGDVRITYHKNPEKGSQYYALNGDLEIGFQEDLSAEIGFDSMNGEIYTDFKVLEQYAKTRKEKPADPDKGMFQYESIPVIRIGSGAVLHQFETLNGNVYLKKI